MFAHYSKCFSKVLITMTISLKWYCCYGTEISWDVRIKGLSGVQFGIM